MITIFRVLTGLCVLVFLVTGIPVIHQFLFGGTQFLLVEAITAPVALLVAGLFAWFAESIRLLRKIAGET